MSIKREVWGSVAFYSYQNPCTMIPRQNEESRPCYQMLHCSRWGTRPPPLFCNLVPKRQWGSVKPWLAASSPPSKRPPDPPPPVLTGSGIPREDHAHRVKLPNIIGYRTKFPQHAQVIDENTIHMIRLK